MMLNRELADYLAKNNMELKELCKELELDYKTVWRWTRKPRLTKVQRLALGKVSDGMLWQKNNTLRDDRNTSSASVHVQWGQF